MGQGYWRMDEIRIWTIARSNFWAFPLSHRRDWPARLSECTQYCGINNRLHFPPVAHAAMSWILLRLSPILEPVVPTVFDPIACELLCTQAYTSMRRGRDIRVGWGGRTTVCLCICRWIMRRAVRNIERVPSRQIKPKDATHDDDEQVSRQEVRK
jgi:hypothetical protein